MKKIYTQQDINEFFNHFKELRNSYELEKVHQLINNPNAKARHSVKLNHNPLKFIIMTTAFIVSVTTLLFWLIPNKNIEVTNHHVIKTERNRNQVSLSEVNEKKVNTNENQINKSNIPAVKTNSSRKINSEDDFYLINANKYPKEKSEIETFKNFSESQLQADTIFDGQKFIVSLSDEEMVRLGFFLDGTGLYYKNNFMGETTYFHSRWESNSGEITHILPFENIHNKKGISSNYDFYPVAISNILYTPREFKRQNFASMNDTLLPILVKRSQLKYGNENLILWFKISENLFNKLPQRYKNLQSDFEKIINLKRQNRNTDLVKYEARNVTEDLHLIELTQIELQKLGFIFKGNTISFKMPFFEINLFKEGQGVTINEDGDAEHFSADYIRLSDSSKMNIIENPQINLVYLSNESGEQNVQWEGQNDDKKKNTFEYFQKKAQFLIPVYLRKSDYPNQLYQNQIFWFAPSMALFDTMPDSIGQQLKREYIYITSETKKRQENLSTTCIYFEACKSTLDVEDFKMYPNPAYLSATIEFSLPVSTTGWISLVSISGTPVKFLVQTTSFSQGRNSFSIDVSDILPGIYLVLLSTDNGFKTQRLIISR